MSFPSEAEPEEENLHSKSNDDAPNRLETKDSSSENNLKESQYHGMIEREIGSIAGNGNEEYVTSDGHADITQAGQKIEQKSLPTNNHKEKNQISQLSRSHGDNEAEQKNKVSLLLYCASTCELNIAMLLN